MIEMKIRDEEILEFAEKLKDVGKQINVRIEGLRNCLNNLCENGISEGNFHNNLELYISLLDAMLDQVDEINIRAGLESITYLSSLDACDGNLY